MGGHRSSRSRHESSPQDCETIHKIVKTAESRQREILHPWASALLYPQLLVRCTFSDPCSSPNRSSGTAGSGSPSRGVAASRPITSTPSTKHTDRAELVGVCDVDPDGAGPGRRARPGPRGSGPSTACWRAPRPTSSSSRRPSGLHADQAVQVAEAGRHVMTEKPMATSWQDGKRMVHACDKAGVHLFVVKQNRRNATLQLLQARGRQAAVRPDLHGEHQRVLDPAAVVLRQRGVARHLGVRRRRLHEPGEPLRGPAGLADRPGGERAGLHGDAGAQHPGRGHRRREHPLAHRRAGLDERDDAHLSRRTSRARSPSSGRRGRCGSAGSR